MNAWPKKQAWGQAKYVTDGDKPTAAGKRQRKRLKRRRRRWLAFEFLEDRTLLSVTCSVDDSTTNTVNCAGSGDLYLQVVTGGTLQYSSDGSNYSAVGGFTVSGDSTVTYGESDTVYLTGMAQGGGTFDMTGPVQIVGDLNTLGGKLEIDAASVIVGAAVLGDVGTLTSGGHSFEIKSSDAHSRTMIVSSTSPTPSNSSTPVPCEQIDTMLTDGQTLAFAGTSGTTPFSLQDGAEYRVQVIREADDSDEIQIQLFATATPPISISTSPASGSSGAAGAITLSASRGDISGGKGTYLATPTVTLGPGSQLQATGNSGDGAISLTADDTFEFVFDFTLVNQIDDLFNHKFQATVEVGQGVAIAGGDVSLTAESGVSSALTSTPNIGQAIGFGVLGFVSTILDNTVLSLPISILITNAIASTEIGEGAMIESSGSVSVSSSATANSTGEATNFLLRNSKAGVFSFTFAKAETSAETLVDANATITAVGDVSIGSITKTTTSATSLESRNPAPGATADPNAFGLSAAVNDLNTTSYAIVAQGASIQSTQGNVTIAAVATDKNTVNVQSNVYRNGIAGLSGAGAIIHADVQACVDGTIIAGGRDTGSAVSLNPFLTTASTAVPSGATPVVDFANSRFVFAADPGYASGEPLVYSSGLGGPIPGLSNNQTYYAIQSQSGQQFYLQLAANAADATAAPPKFIAFGQYPTIN
ncbi:MAG: hypothetical protein ABI614_08975, partial [Planctomycetota bacterium]